MALVLTIALCLGTLAACGSMPDSVIVVAGSTSVQPYAEVLAEEFEHQHSENGIDVQGGGSTAGVTAVESGIADIGMSSRSLKEAEQALWSIEIAKDGLAVIVHPQNPIADLSLTQVRGIYSGEISRWSELGGVGTQIHVIAREEGSGTRSAFEELVMGNHRITPRAIIQDSNGAVMQLVADDRNAVGFVSLGLVELHPDAVKALRLDGVEASGRNVVSGTYGLYRPFLFVTDGEPKGLTKQFVDFVLSAPGQQILEREGLVPVTADREDEG